MIFQEEYSSQIPALRTLINLGYRYLSNEEVMTQRQGRTTNVLLEPILKEQLHKLNEIRVSSSQTERFSKSNIDEAVMRLKEIPFEKGYLSASEYIYELLTLGTTLNQIIDGNRREYTLQYIDWKNIDNNVFHLAEEFSVATTQGDGELRPDIVLFVNGIPLAVIENKRADMDNPIKQAISQHLRNQQEDRIRRLYVYAQLLLSCSVNDAKYATNGTPEEFWNRWKEQHIEPHRLEIIKQLPIDKATAEKIVERRSGVSGFNKAKELHIGELLTMEFAPTEQDVLLCAVAEPERLLDLTNNFILYDKGVKKIARYQQYFAVKNAMKQITGLHTNPRPGGVIWHTQGSGKSLTMALMAEAIAKDKTIHNPLILLVTDRTDLDKQITGTFNNVGVKVINATSGGNLVEILQTNTDAVITTIINKFETAVARIEQPLTSNNIFVLVDEGHRTQHGTFNINMQKTMPNACFIAFTGTPLFIKDRNTLHKFGNMIDQYTVRQAVEDEAVLPLVYEGRYTDQDVNKGVIDRYFQKVSEGLSEYEKADLKQKFSQRTHIADAEQNISAIAWDITEHYRKNFQGTGLKGQLVCSSKRTAVRYYNEMKQIGKVDVALVMSPPDDREGEDSAYVGVTDDVKLFWKAMMDQHSSQRKYEENIISRFKNEDCPEIIIVVDKLLTGFDAPNNTVLYLTRKLRGHTLLQAIARVNRLHSDKDYGYIVDYAGVVQELDNALLVYSDMEDFDDKDLAGTLTSIKDEIAKLDDAHQELLDMFKHISNKKDIELYQQALREKDVRDSFYKRLASYARILKLALSSIDFHNDTSERKMEGYKADLKFYMNLRTAVAQRFSDKVDYKQYEGQIQKLIDQHISTQSVEQLTELVNIFDEEAFEKELEKTVGAAAKADTIASRTSKHISEKMDEDPAFYRKFSQMIQQAINEFYNQRISELEYLRKIKEYRDNVMSATDSDIPESIRNKPAARANFGIVKNFYNDNNIDIDEHEELLIDAALHIEKIIDSKRVVNWEANQDVQNRMVLEIGDYIFDVVNSKIGLEISFSEIDKIGREMVTAAKTRG